MSASPRLTHTLRVLVNDHARAAQTAAAGLDYSSARPQDQDEQAAVQVAQWLLVAAYECLDAYTAPRGKGFTSRSVSSIMAGLDTVLGQIEEEYNIPADRRADR